MREKADLRKEDGAAAGLDYGASQLIVLVWGSNSVGGHDGSTVSHMLAERMQDHCVEKSHCEKPEVIYISFLCI